MYKPKTDNDLPVCNVIQLLMTASVVKGGDTSYEQYEYDSEVKVIVNFQLELEVRTDLIVSDPQVRSDQEPPH